MFPLLLAVWNSLDHIVEILLSAGANVDEQNNEGWAAIHEIMFRQASEGDARLCRILVEDWKANLDTRLPNGSTALHLAAQKGRVGCINVILDAGFDVNDSNFLGQTALHAAAEYSQKDAIQVLLARGADLSIEDEKGQMTALDVAEFKLNPSHHERVSPPDNNDNGSEVSEVAKLLRAAHQQRRSLSTS